MKPICTFLCVILVASPSELFAQQAMPRGLDSGADAPTEFPLPQGEISPQPYVVDTQTLARIHRRLRGIKPLAMALSPNQQWNPFLQPPFSPPNGSVVDEVVTGAVGTAGLGVIFGLMWGANCSETNEADPPKCNRGRDIALGAALGAGLGALGGLVVGFVKEH